MNTQSTLELLQQLKLAGMAQAYQGMLSLPVHQQLSLHEGIARLSEAEAEHRQDKRTHMYLKLGKLRYNALPEQIHCSSERNFTKEQLTLLVDGSFIDQAKNVIITGATGCGKSFMACALGRQAIIMGYKTLFLDMTRFIEKVAQTKLDGTFVRWINQLHKVPLLILDDFGIHPIDSNTRLALLQILEDRYGNKPVMITSQLPIDAWYEYIGEPTLADAIMDRLSAKAHHIQLKGKSLRKLDFEN